ncbi:hypothetical protein AWW67_10390 [Roseivirga seohaensis]|uniref:Uncharacterized protein n=2 Tax=Roseivirga seohaensis TaxID=1914963 RepID=A0A0L8AIP9_9BACT|nr:hypothetical protein [Roseivirga seohaensis]KOF02102.1 hypothetical protein OB69_13830 [Roseivirga seohaensis subsp. aquiponti]KYG79724.1 hypothetical protein AWW67_10390 [Roseivirga seohaensis]
MISSLIIALAGVFGLFKLKKAKSQFTKLVIVLLGFSAIASVVNYYEISTYAPVAIGFFSLLASFESTSSFSMKKPQILFFVLSGLGFFIFSLASVLPLDVYIIDWPFLILFFIGLGYHWFNHGKKIKSRMGILIVWSGLAISWLFTLVASMF